MMEKKKSQMEILGLLVVIILFSLGLLFALRYSILKPEAKTREAFVQAQLSSNTLSAFLKTTSDCRNADMTELFRDCAAFPKLDCEPDGRISDTNGLYDSCKTLNNALRLILNETLNKWHIDYNFTAFIDDKDQPLAWTKEIGNGKCGEFDEGKPQQFTIPTDAGDLTVELKIC